MSDEKALARVHPEGEPETAGKQTPEAALNLDTFGGKIQFRWEPGAGVSSLGQMAFFIEFLKTSGLLEEWVKDCPLTYTSPNAPAKRDVLGPILLSVLSGHWRYAHMSALRGDGVNPGLLGMTKVASEDSVRRALSALKEEESEQWLKKHLRASYEPLLEEPWAMDVDTTVKVLHGHQEDAKVGYNPQKPGRPSHAHHSHFIGNLRLVMDVEVQAGNQTASSFAQPELWSLLDGMPKSRHPAFPPGDCGWGNERAMEGAGQRQIPYLFKLKQSANVKKLIVKLLGKEQWVEAGQRWQGLDAELSLDLPEAMYRGVLYEYAVLVTSLTDEIRTIAQHYRDRGDSENNFDELKNQWGWAGFTTQDRKRCQVMARITALIYNWWNIFMRLAIPDQHAEAITSRPLALHGIARRTRHGNQTTIEVASTHSKAPLIAQALRRVSGVLKHVKEIAEQLTCASRWKLILSAAFQHFLCGKVLGGTGRLSPLPANCRF